MSLTLHAGHGCAEILLSLDAGCLDDLGPLCAVALEDRAGLLQRSYGGDEAERIQALLHVSEFGCLADLSMEQGHDVSRRAGWHEQANPEIAFNLGKAR